MAGTPNKGMARMGATDGLWSRIVHCPRSTRGMVHAGGGYQRHTGHRLAAGWSKPGSLCV